MSRKYDNAVFITKWERISFDKLPEKYLERISQMISQNEKILYCLLGNWKFLGSIDETALIITSNKLIIFTIYKNIPPFINLSQIRKVDEYRPFLGGSALYLDLGGGVKEYKVESEVLKIEFGSSDEGLIQEFHSNLINAMAKSQQFQISIGVSSNDIVEQLKKLEDLYRYGVFDDYATFFL